MNTHQMNNDKKVLIIKTSSMGDIIHTLPALSDCGLQKPGTRFDWVVESSFSDIPALHPLIDNVIPVSIRKWRKNPLQSVFSHAWKKFRTHIAEQKYDAIIDAQGLLKSAFLAPMANGHRYGFNRSSARESLASLFYQTRINSDKNQHAVERIRQLFASALGYQVPEGVGDYGIKFNFPKIDQAPYLVFLHGTTWESKHYPEQYWHELIAIAAKNGLKVKLLWGTDSEYQRAKRLSANYRHTEVMPKLKITEIAELLASATACIAVDTGLGHLAAAVDCPTLSLFSSTNQLLTGAYGKSQRHLSSTLSCNPCFKRICTLNTGQRKIKDNSYDSFINPPCFSTIPPEIVWLNLQLLPSNQ